MDKKTYLCRYHNLLEKIEKKQEYIDFCHERAGAIPGMSYGDRVNNPSRSNEAPFVKWIYRAVEAEEELKQLEEKARKAKMEIETAIASLEDETLQMILIYRYIDWLAWSEIATKVYFSDKTVRRKHDLAIELLKMTSDDQPCPIVPKA